MVAVTLVTALLRKFGFLEPLRHGSRHNRLQAGMHCTCVDEGFKRFFRWLGGTVSRHYVSFMIIPPLIALTLGTGAWWGLMDSIEDNAEFLFSPLQGQAKDERALVESYFSPNLSHEFDVGRITRLGRFARLFVLPHDGGSVFRRAIFEDLLLADQYVNNVSISWNGTQYFYRDLCAKNKGKCFENTILNYYSKIDIIEKGRLLLKYPVMSDPRTLKILFIPIFLGGVETDQRGYIHSAKSAGLLYVLDNSNATADMLSAMWEEEYLRRMGEVELPHVSLKRFVSESLGKELHRNIMSVLKFFVLSVVFMVCYSVTATSNNNWIISKPWLGFFGCMTALMGVIASYGFCIYLGVSWIAMNIAILFIMIGIGMDDTFVLLAAWWRTDPRHTVAERVVETYANSAISITITSLTNFLSFFVGMFTPFPATYIFCTYASAAIVFSYLLQITFFGGVLVFAGHMEKENRHSLFYFWGVISPEKAKEKGCIFQFLCSGKGADDLEVESNQFAAIFRDYIGGALTKPLVQFIVLTVFSVYLGFGLYGCTKLHEGLEVDKLFQEESYAADYYNHEFKYFSNYYLRIQLVLTGDINYADPLVQEKIENFTAKVEANPFMANNSIGLTESWLRILKSSYPYYVNFKGLNMSNPQVFIKTVKESFLTFPPHQRFANDIIFNENGTKIVASRILFQSMHITDTNVAKHLLLEVRKLASEAPFNVTFFNAWFPFMDHFIIIRSVTFDSILITLFIMGIVAFLFIPSLVSIILMTMALLSIQIGIIGFMSLWKIPLDPISMICLIMCVGFSVDSSAHILHSYRDSHEKDPDKKMQDALYKVGLPILQGCISSLIAIIALILEGAFIFWTFFRIILLVLVFGALHSIFLLPILLNFADRLFRRREKPEDPAVCEPLTPQPNEGLPQVTPPSFTKHSIV